MDKTEKNTPIARVPGSDDHQRSWVISFVAVVIAMMAMQMSSLGFTPLLPDMQKAFSMSYSQVGMFTGVYGLVAIVISVPAGLLANRFGEKNVLSMGLLILALGLFALSVAGNYYQALGSRVLWLVGYRLSFICVMTAVALTAPIRFKGLAMGILGAMSAMASVVGAPFGSNIGEAFGWRHGIMAFAGMALFGLAIFWLFYKQAPAVSSKVRAAGGHGSMLAPEGKVPGIFSAFKSPIVWTIPLLGMCNAGGFAATFFVPVVLKSEFKLGANDAAFVISMAYMSAIISNLIFGYVADRFNRWLVLAGMMALMIPATLAMNSSNLLAFEIATAMLVSLGLSATVQIYPAAAELMRGRDTGTIMGIVALGGGLFGYLGPQSLGWLRDWSGGFAAGWYAISAATLCVLMLILFLQRYSDRQNRMLAGTAA